jgi:predicted ribonuclease YlaK
MELHEELETIPWHGTIRERARRAVHVVIPIIVIDQLDRLKRSQGDMILRGKKVARRTVARQALRTLSRMFERHDDRVGIDQADAGSRSNPVSIELLLDPPGHTRLASPDAEIRDRAIARSAYANRVVLVTYDLGNTFAAQFEGLEVIRLKDTEEVAGEPAPERPPPE